MAFRCLGVRWALMSHDGAGSVHAMQLLRSFNTALLWLANEFVDGTRA